MRWSMTTLPAFALGLALLCGCTTTDNPIGISGGAQVDARLVGGWKGVFADQYSDKVKYQVVFLPGEKGALAAIVAGWTLEGGQWAVYEVVAGRAGDHTVLNMRSVIENGAPARETSAYIPSLYRFEPDGSLRLFMLSEQAVADAIQSGRLAGTMGTGQLATNRITADPQSLDDFFAEAAPALFTEPYAVLQPIY
jgi:hypothetical protein